MRQLPFGNSSLQTEFKFERLGFWQLNCSFKTGWIELAQDSSRVSLPFFFPFFVFWVGWGLLFLPFGFIFSATSDNKLCFFNQLLQKTRLPKSKIAYKKETVETVILDVTFLKNQVIPIIIVGITQTHMWQSRIAFLHGTHGTSTLCPDSLRADSLRGHVTFLNSSSG